MRIFFSLLVGSPILGMLHQVGSLAFSMFLFAVMGGVEVS